MEKKATSFTRTSAAEMTPFYHKPGCSQAQHCCDRVKCLSPGWENCAVPSAQDVSHDKRSVFSLSPSLCTSLSSDRPKHQPFPSGFCVRAQGTRLFACRVTNLTLNEASISFTARGKLQTLNSFSGLVLYILEGIFYKSLSILLWWAG